MLHYSKRMLFIPLVLLWPLSSAKVPSPDSQVDNFGAVPFGLNDNKSHFLYPRVDSQCGASYSSNPDVPLCRPLCAPSQSGCSNGPKKRNSYPNDTANDDDDDDHAAQRSVPKAALDRRAFQNMDLAEIREYIPQQTDEDTVDPYYGELLPIIEFEDGNVISTDASLAQQKRFGKTAFQIGTAGLEGCTVVTVVSKRGVYMAHYWEEESWVNPNAFTMRIINFIANRDPQQGVGPALNTALFNRRNDDTRIYIMHPRAEGTRLYTSPTYEDELAQLKSLLNEDLLPGAPTATWMYIAVPWRKRNGQWYDPIANQPWRRHAIFQYDPNAHGPGNKGWRLFYEDHYFDDTNPPPGPESANGIPDLP